MKKPIIFAFALSIAPMASASDDHHPHHPDNNTSLKKNVFYIPVGAVIAVGVTLYCVTKRFILNDPCIKKESEWKKTSASDDKVAPPQQQQLLLDVEIKGK